MKNNIYEEIKSIIAEKSTLLEICQTVLTLIQSKEQNQQLDYFKTFLNDTDLPSAINDADTFFEGVSSKSATPKSIEIFKYGEIIVSGLVKKNVEEKIFYDELWKRIHDDILAEDSESKVLLLARFWSDTRIPYYQVGDSCDMSDDEFKQIVTELSPQISKANFIMYVGFPQRTQEISLLMNVADEIADKRKQSVFWAVMLEQMSTLKANRQMQEMRDMDE